MYDGRCPTWLRRCHHRAHTSALLRSSAPYKRNPFFLPTLSFTIPSTLTYTSTENDTAVTNMSGKSVFFTGATGYIGGTVLEAVITSNTPPSKITVLIRDPAKINGFTSLEIARKHNVTIVPLLGSLEEYNKLRDAAADHDVVMSCANADDLAGMKAILEGMKKRKEKSGHRPLLIQTSGTGVLTDDARGEYPTDTVR